MLQDDINACLGEQADLAADIDQQQANIEEAEGEYEQSVAEADEQYEENEAEVEAEAEDLLDQLAAVSDDRDTPEDTIGPAPPRSLADTILSTLFPNLAKAYDRWQSGYYVVYPDAPGPIYDALADLVALGVGAIGKVQGALESTIAAERQGISEAADAIAQWLGKDAKVIVNKEGDYVFLSQDGTRKVRFDINDPSPHGSPHGHADEFIDGKWVRSEPIYPKDVPNN